MPKPMVRLREPKGPQWITLAIGVGLRVRPLNHALYSAAWAIARREVGKLVAAIHDGDRETADLYPELNREEDGPEARAAVVETFFAQALAEMAVLDWRGVYPERGRKPLPLTREHLRLLLDKPNVPNDFALRYVADHEGLVLEGKESRTAPYGSSRAVRTIAGAASSSEAPARAASRTTKGGAAPSTKRSPRRRKAGPPSSSSSPAADSGAVPA